MVALTHNVARHWTPPDAVRAGDWIPANIVIPDETETPGPFDLDAFPHVRGVLDAWDHPTVRRILMPWASRLGKTVTGLSLLCCAAATQPRPMMIGRETEPAINDLIDSQLRPLVQACRPLRKELLPRQNVRSVRFRTCRIRRTYAGSPGTMAGFPACYALASEVSKWPHPSTSTEASPIRLFARRGTLFPFNSKYIFESTPGLAGRCNITSLCDAPGVDIRRRLVPCPHCGTYQELLFGSGEPDSPGVRWDKGPHGRSEPHRAEATAWYRCVNGCRIENTDRPELLRNGRWISVGQEIDPEGHITGEPDCPDGAVVAFGHPDRHPVGSLHSLVISGWGQIAREFLEAKDSPEGLRELENQTFGRVWNPRPKVIEPDALARQLGTSEPSRVCPPWSVFLTFAADVGGDADEFHWQICGWGQHARGAVIDYGLALSEQELIRLVTGLHYPHADGGQPLYLSRGVIDSGSGLHTDRIYRLCAALPGIVPCKGMHGFSEFVRVRELTEVTRRRKKSSRWATSGVLYEINHDRSQRWLQSQLDDRNQSLRQDRLTLTADVVLETAGPFLSHLAAEYPVDRIDADGNIVYGWERTGDNEQRDCLRYNRAVADLLMLGGKNWAGIRRLPPNDHNQPAPAPAASSSGFRTPDGRPYLVTER